MIESGRKSSSLVNCSRVSINLSVWLLIGLFSIVLRGLHVTGCQEPILFIFSILGNIPVKVLRRIVQYCQGQFTVPNNWAKVLFTSIMTQLAALMVRVIPGTFYNSLQSVSSEWCLVQMNYFNSWPFLMFQKFPDPLSEESTLSEWRLGHSRLIIAFQWMVRFIGAILLLHFKVKARFLSLITLQWTF